MAAAARDVEAGGGGGGPIGNEEDRRRCVPVQVEPRRMGGDDGLHEMHPIASPLSILVSVKAIFLSSWRQAVLVVNVHY